MYTQQHSKDSGNVSRIDSDVSQVLAHGHALLAITPHFQSLSLTPCNQSHSHTITLILLSHLFPHCHIYSHTFKLNTTLSHSLLHCNNYFHALELGLFVNGYLQCCKQQNTRTKGYSVASIKWATVLSAGTAKTSPVEPTLISGSARLAFCRFQKINSLLSSTIEYNAIHLHLYPW